VAKKNVTAAAAIKFKLFFFEMKTKKKPKTERISSSFFD